MQLTLDSMEKGVVYRALRKDVKVGPQIWNLTTASHRDVVAPDESIYFLHYIDKATYMANQPVFLVAGLFKDRALLSFNRLQMNAYFEAVEPFAEAERLPESANWQFPMFAARARSTGICTTGWDPEIFVVDAKKRLLPAFTFLPSKSAGGHIYNDPSAVHGATGGTAYWDGFQAEFTTRPYTCHGYAIDQVRAGLQTVLSAARQYDRSSNLTLQNVFRVTKKTLNSLPAEFVALACNPSQNVYGTEPFVAANPFEIPYRAAGGHIHFGLSPQLMQDCKRKSLSANSRLQNAIKRFDLLVGLPSVGLFAEIDNPLRRRYYGRAGEYRLTDYGVELRSLSNAWLGAPEIAHVLMDLARKCFIFDAPFNDFVPADISEQVRNIIDSTDVKAARALYKQYQFVWEKLLYYLYPAVDTKGNSYKLFSHMVLHGVESKYPTYRDIETNWKLGSLWLPHSDATRAVWNRWSQAQ